MLFIEYITKVNATVVIWDILVEKLTLLFDFA